MNENSIFLKTLDKTEKRLKKMLEQTQKARFFCEYKDMAKAYEQTMRLEEDSERMVLLTRSLPVYTGSPRAVPDVDNVIARYIPVDVGYTVENWFSVSMPLLLPKKEDGSTDYIRSSLYITLRDFFLHRPPVRYDDCVLIYRHVYDSRRPERKKRDHDNIEVNMVTDIIALYVMPDDGPEVCNHYYCSAPGSEERTEIYVVPKNEFPLWLITEKAMPEEGIMLYEERHF
jgi:hypothetical protein